MSGTIVSVVDRWHSTAGGIQTVNRQLMRAIAQLRPEIECVVVSSFASAAERSDAVAGNITLLSGMDEDIWDMGQIRADFLKVQKSAVKAVVGHGLITGPVAQQIRNQLFPDAKLIHFVHTIPLLAEAFKEYRKETFSAEREQRLAEELALARTANIVACIGPRIFRFVHDALISSGRDISQIVQLNCGITEEQQLDPPLHTTVLFLGRTKSVALKGIDIFAHAAGALTQKWSESAPLRLRPAPNFTVRGPESNPETLQRSLLTISDSVYPGARIIVRPYTSEESVVESDIRQSSVLVLPSREEGYGLVACEAISRGTPVLLSRETGIAELVGTVSHDAIFDWSPLVVDVRGTRAVAGNRTANKLLDILADESYSRLRALRLREMLLPLASWNKAADDFAACVFGTRTGTDTSTEKGDDREKQAKSRKNVSEAGDFLSRNEIDGLLNVLTKSGLVDLQRRLLLFHSIPDNFLSDLPIYTRPLDQYRSDLAVLNNCPPLTDATDPPLAIWLSNAIRLLGPRSEARELEQMLLTIARKPQRQSTL